MRARYLTDDEYARILRALPPERRLLFELARHTGLRIGDVVKIRKADLSDGGAGLSSRASAAAPDTSRGRALGCGLRARQRRRE